MEVYIVEWHDGYESSSIKGVFSTYEKAKSYIEKEYRTATHDSDDRWYYSSEYLTISMYEVK